MACQFCYEHTWRSEDLKWLMTLYDTVKEHCKLEGWYSRTNFSERYLRIGYAKCFEEANSEEEIVKHAKEAYQNFLDGVKQVEKQSGLTFDR